MDCPTQCSAGVTLKKGVTIKNIISEILGLCMTKKEKKPIFGGLDIVQWLRNKNP